MRRESSASRVLGCRVLIAIARYESDVGVNGFDNCQKAWNELLENLSG
jgi:hypothetical protein